jgi:hypothetical protein
MFISRNLRGILEHGVQKSMDVDEPRGPVNPSALLLAIKTMLGYAGSIGTTLWCEINCDHRKVGKSRFVLELCCSDRSLSVGVGADH